MAMNVGSGRSGGSGLPGRSYRRAPMSDINVTPFVDVMLVLLIVFMVTAPLLTVGVAVDLPETSANRIVGQDEPLVISVNSDGGVFLQDTEIKLDQLIPRLTAITENKKDARIFLRGDQAIAYGRVMSVMGALNQAGFNKVALITQVLSKKASQGAR
ncbi:MAG: protein TolR [Alphaproteobacteria bacterium]|jgi:biopolymer transport protein TolR|tara:strand:- start:94 stop:564 length:471 start_codon:yes stop_codon:yes gene_type:complete